MPSSVPPKALLSRSRIRVASAVTRIVCRSVLSRSTIPSRVNGGGGRLSGSACCGAAVQMPTQSVSEPGSAIVVDLEWPEHRDPHGSIVPADGGAVGYGLLLAVIQLRANLRQWLEAPASTRRASLPLSSSVLEPPPLAGMNSWDDRTNATREGSRRHSGES